MKKKKTISNWAIAVFFLAITIPLKINALNYTISFTGTGASTSVDSVIVQNLTKGTTVTVPTGNLLNLSDVTTSTDNVNEVINEIQVYPNPIQDKSTISFLVKQAGLTQVNVFDLNGRKVIGISRTLTQGINSCKVCIPNGVYIFSVQGNGFSYYAKAISLINSKIKPQIAFTSNENQFTNKLQKSKSIITTTMQYSHGDQLLFKGISDNYSTVITDKPTESKTINFEFIECKDADENLYAVVKIGTQVWMVENLKTTKYNDGNTILEITDNITWSTLKTGACCNYNNDVTNSNKYGKLYNWHAIDTGKLAPIGWHIPSDSEWSTLDAYVAANPGSASSSAKALATNYNWQVSIYNNAIGSNILTNNSSGFSALPGGSVDSNGLFYDFGIDGYWWSSLSFDTNSAWYRSMGSDYNYVFRWNFNKNTGLSVRCIKD